MNLLRAVAVAGLCGMLIPSGAARAETTVELKGVHICCNSCVRAVADVMKGVEGVKAVCDRQAKTVTIAAKDDAAAKKAVEALVNAGFHGKSGNKDVGVPAVADVPPGKVKSLKLSGVHNCCGQCTRQIKALLKKVDGVTGDTVSSEEKSFEVTGDFEAAAVVKALNEAGFHAKVAK